jgi:uncharacterized short protein YbdD (DUF466 family)
MRSVHPVRLPSPTRRRAGWTTLSRTIAGAAAGWLARAASVLRRVLGAPDYELYLVHMRQSHPDVIPLAADAFTREVLARRYERPGSRCC